MNGPARFLTRSFGALRLAVTAITLLAMAQMLPAQAQAQDGGSATITVNSYMEDGNTPLPFARFQVTDSIDELGDVGVDQLDLAVEEVDLAQAAVDRLALFLGEVLAGEPGTPALAEQVARRRAPEQAASEHRMDLVLGPGAVANERPAARQAPAQRAGPLIADPDLGQQVRREQPRQRRRVEAVGLDARVADRPHLLGVGDDDPGDVRLEDASDRKRRAGRLEDDLVIGGQAPGEELERRRRSLDPSGVFDFTLRGHRYLAEVAMHVQGNAAHQPLLSSTFDFDREPGGQHDNYGFALAAQPGKSQGRPVSD